MLPTLGKYVIAAPAGFFNLENIHFEGFVPDNVEFYRGQFLQRLYLDITVRIVVVLVWKYL